MVYNYGRFHADTCNQVIHFIFIPVIVYTLGLLLGFALPIVEVPFTVPLLGDKLSVALLLPFLASVGYMMIDVPVAMAFLTWVVPMTCTAHH